MSEPQPSLDPDNDFWRFSGAVYAAAGVEGACLSLQDGFGIDVNLALFCLWVGAARGGAVEAADVDAAAVLVSDWQAEVVAPLRAVRRRVKRMALVADPGVAAFRGRVAAVELDGERIEQALLFRWAEPRWPPRPFRAGRAAANLRVLLRRRWLGDPVPTEAEAAAAVLAEAGERHAAGLSAR
jgi:uncharacterized protein (TIGR02444 family)